MKKLIVWAVFFIILTAFWQAALTFKLVSPAALAGPFEVFAAMPYFIQSKANLPDTLSTLSRSMAAFVLSVPIGIFAGVAIAGAKKFKPPAEFSLDFLRSIPATALVPVFLIICGIGDSTKVVVGTFSSALAICLSTMAGFNGRNRTRMGVAKILGIKGARRLFLVDIPEAAQQIFLGLRTGISLALILVVVSEMLIGANNGLGKVIADMRYTDDKARMYAAIIAAGIIGYMYNLILSVAEKKIIHWRGVQ